MSTRREFLRNSVIASLGATLLGTRAGAAISSADEVVSANTDVSATRPRAAGAKSVHDLKAPALDNLRIGLIGLGQRGGMLLPDILHTKLGTVTAVCDLRQERADKSAALVKKTAGNTPATFGGAEDAWEKLIARDDIDVVIVATPWEWHVPMAVAAMKAGKHVFVEVSAAVTIDQCWQLVDTSEVTQKHCVMLENCCYGESELFVLNMARNGVFGELTHGEAAYIHNLRSMLFMLGTEGDWRREYHKRSNGNLYPTHGLGPVSQYMGINRGDKFESIVSVSSLEHGLTKYRDEHKPNGGKHAAEKYIAGDMNTSVIKTKLGRTIMVQHDIVSPRPYSRINALSGTGATFFGYPDRIAIDEPSKYGLSAGAGAHEWIEPVAVKKDKKSGAYSAAESEDYKKLQERFTHPLIKRLKQFSKGAGHGGMDFVMLYRHLEALKKGQTPDSTVYDAAAWSSVLELSARSVATGSAPTAFPDFTRGAWDKLPPLPVVA